MNIAQLQSRPAERSEPSLGAATGEPIAIRPGTSADAPSIDALVTANRVIGHLLPRTLDDLVRHAHRFLVLTDGSGVIGCGEVAPLTRAVAEVRSLVVDERYRGRGLGSRLVDALKRRARVEGFQTLCAFTHEPASFVRQGFSIVPHVWLPEKITHDCHSCPLFRQCGQYAMWFTLQPAVIARPVPASIVASRLDALSRPAAGRS